MYVKGFQDVMADVDLSIWLILYERCTCLASMRKADVQTLNVKCKCLESLLVRHIFVF